MTFHHIVVGSTLSQASVSVLLETELGDQVTRTFPSTTRIESRVIMGEVAEMTRQVVHRGPTSR